MNLGRSGIEKEKDQLNAVGPRIGNSIGVVILRVVLFLIIAVATALVCFGAGAYRGIIADSPSITDVNIMPMGYASFIYDDQGNQIQKLNSVEGNRVSISIDEIPQDMQHAIVAIEDSRFYEHNGVDPHGMIRAFMVMFSSGGARSEGASTITQQLLKNNVFTDWLSESRVDTIRRKLQEQYLAVQLEESLKAAGKDPKAVILENYLNTVNFGHGAYGVQTAAQTYFGKDAKDLTLSECAVLAAIPQNPSQFDPILYPEDNAERRQTVLDYMLNQGYITQEAHDEAMADDVYSRIEVHSTQNGTTEVYSYFVDELIDEVKTALMQQKGYTEVQATNAIYSGGLKIYSTESANVQSVMEEEFSNPDNFPPNMQVGLDWALTVNHADGSQENYSREMLQTWMRQNVDETFDLNFGSSDEAQAAIDTYKAAVIVDTDTVIAERTSFIPEPQACMTVIDQSNGQVKGIVGGLGTKEGSLTLNRATDSYRQPGSTFKIPSTYGPALDLGKATLATNVVDDQTAYEDGTIVNNADDNHYGSMSIRNAIITSNNVVAVKVITDITPRVAYEYLKKLGITSLVDDTEYDIRQTLALGGITNGVSNLELTGAYAAIANGGTYIEPTFYTKVTDKDGNVILDNTPSTTKVFKDSTSWLLTSAMTDVVSSGTGTGYRLNVGLPVAGKTGTTDSVVDLTFVGFTPYYTAGIWAGYDTNYELPEKDRLYIQTLWTNVMNRINSNLEYKDFTQPESVEALTVCSQSGLLAGRGCTPVTEYFDTANAPSTICTQHIPAPTPTPTPTPTEKADSKDSDSEKSDSEDSDSDESDSDESEETDDSESDDSGEYSDEEYSEE